MDLVFCFCIWENGAEARILQLRRMLDIFTSWTYLKQSTVYSGWFVHVEQQQCSFVPPLNVSVSCCHSASPRRLLGPICYLTPVLPFNLRKQIWESSLRTSHFQRDWSYTWPWAQFWGSGARGSSGEQGTKVLCPPLKDMNEGHKFALSNFLERSRSKVLPFIIWCISL